MSYSMLEAVFNGTVIPWERKCTHSPERRALERKIEQEKQYFVEKMSLDDCQRFEQLFNLLMEASCDEETDLYSHGFALGSLITLEVMEKKETIIRS